MADNLVRASKGLVIMEAAALCYVSVGVGGVGGVGYVIVAFIVTPILVAVVVVLVVMLAVELKWCGIYALSNF